MQQGRDKNLAALAAGTAIQSARLAGVTGQRADQGMATLGQAVQTQAERGLSPDALELSGFSQRMQGRVGYDRASATAAQYATYQNPAAMGIKGALKQYADARQTAAAMRGARTLEDFLSNEENMSAEDRFNVDRAGEGGAYALRGRGFSGREVKALREGDLPSSYQSLTATGAQRAGERSPDREAAATLARTDLELLAAVTQNTEKIIRAQVVFEKALVSAGDSINSFAATVKTLGGNIGGYAR